jgi:phage protein U
MLFQWGTIQFEVFPLNVHQMDHATQSEWARKEIVGAATYREWVGEGDDEVTLRGKVFPHFMSAKLRERGQPNSSGGLGHLDVLDGMRRLGQAHLLIRGDGWKLGWYVIEKLARGHTMLGADGIGQQIEFQATFQRVPVPNPDNYLAFLWGALNGG